ncbi:MAG: adenosine-specific kinase [Nitrososphaerales archaeon]|nr:adenosine-specific kinase [Nitrososphaerales archaeon]
MKIEQVELLVPDGFQLVLGQSHFIKTVEDIYETLSTAVPGIKFGVAFCEASGKALVRFDGTDQRSIDLACDYASRVAAGHCFAVVLNGAFPINVLNRIKAVEEVVGIYCATSNNVVVAIAETGSGRGVLGVVDGAKSAGLEKEADKRERREFLRKIGYKR